MAYIYMVRCQDESLYTGIAHDVGKRMREHYYKKKTGAKYTKSRQVTALEMVWQTETWSGAARLEYQIKQLRKNQKEALIREPEQVARMHELFGTTGSETSLQIDPGLIRCQTCVSAYIGAAFLCSGTVTDPQKEYSIEFLTSRTNLARDFEALLAEHEFAPHRTRRNGVNLVYVKSCDNVERILSFMGAAEASTRLSAQKAVKQVRNQINRHTNCDTANLSKTARANAQTLKAIRFLDEQGALETLPEALQQAAARRLKYPDLSLAALCASFDPPMSKSGLSHRMKKLEALADALRQRLAEQSSKTDTEEVRA